MILATVTSSRTVQGGCKEAVGESEEFSGGGVDQGAMWGSSEGKSCIQRRHIFKGSVVEGN